MAFATTLIPFVMLIDLPEDTDEILSLRLQVLDLRATLIAQGQVLVEGTLRVTICVEEDDDDSDEESVTQEIDLTAQVQIPGAGPESQFTVAGGISDVMTDLIEDEQVRLAGTVSLCVAAS